MKKPYEIYSDFFKKMIILGGYYEKVISMGICSAKHG